MCCKLHRTGCQDFVSQQKYSNFYRTDIKTSLPKVTNMILAGKIVTEFMLNTSD